MIKQITSRSNPLIVRTSELKSPSARHQQQQFLIEGDHLIEMAATAGLLRTVFTLEPREFADNIDVYQVSESVLDKLSSLKSKSKIIGVAAFPSSELKGASRLVYLDDVQDPGNVGTIIRTALALGYDGVVTSLNSADFYSPKVISASQGAIFSLPLMRLAPLELKKLFPDHQLIATTLEGATDLSSVTPASKFILLLGSEGQGLSSTCINLADYKVKIAIDHIESLNVAIAGAIFMYAFRRK